MHKKKSSRIITNKLICKFAATLREQEKSSATVQKYLHDLTSLCEKLDGTPLTKAMLIDWKENLAQRYAPTSVNTMLASLNSLLTFCGWSDLKVKALKIQNYILP